MSKLKVRLGISFAVVLLGCAVLLHPGIASAEPAATPAAESTATPADPATETAPAPPVPAPAAPALPDPPIKLNAPVPAPVSAAPPAPKVTVPAPPKVAIPARQVQEVVDKVQAELPRIEKTVIETGATRGNGIPAVASAPGAAANAIGELANPSSTRPPGDTPNAGDAIAGAGRVIDGATGSALQGLDSVANGASAAVGSLPSLPTQLASVVPKLQLQLPDLVKTLGSALTPAADLIAQIAGGMNSTARAPVDPLPNQRDGFRGVGGLMIAAVEIGDSPAGIGPAGVLGLTDSSPAFGFGGIPTGTLASGPNAGGLPGPGPGAPRDAPGGIQSGTGAGANGFFLVGFAALLLLALTAAAPAIRRTIQIASACWRPVPFVALLERPG